MTRREKPLLINQGTLPNYESDSVLQVSKSPAHRGVQMLHSGIVCLAAVLMKPCCVNVAPPLCLQLSANHSHPGPFIIPLQ